LYSMFRTLALQAALCKEAHAASNVAPSSFPPRPLEPRSHASLGPVVTGAMMHVKALIAMRVFIHVFICIIVPVWTAPRLEWPLGSSGCGGNKLDVTLLAA
jgi:hypothetical protein